MVPIYAKNRPWSGEPRCDFVRIAFENPRVLRGYRINGGRLVDEPTPIGYLERYSGWYHPATAWEIEEFKRLGGYP